MKVDPDPFEPQVVLSHGYYHMSRHVTSCTDAKICVQVLDILVVAN